MVATKERRTYGLNHQVDGEAEWDTAKILLRNPLKPKKFSARRPIFSAPYLFY